MLFPSLTSNDSWFEDGKGTPGPENSSPVIESCFIEERGAEAASTGEADCRVRRDDHRQEI